MKSWRIILSAVSSSLRVRQLFSLCSESALPFAGNAISNLVVNSAVLAAGVGIYVFDQKVTSGLKDKLEDELKNPYLKGDLKSYLEEKQK